MPLGRAQVAATAAVTQWERRRGVGSPQLPRHSAGGAIAPATAMLHTLPAHHRRLTVSDIAGDNMDGKFGNLGAQLVAEFGRVHNDIAALQNAPVDSVTESVFDKSVHSIDNTPTA